MADQRMTRRHPGGWRVAGFSLSQGQVADREMSWHRTRWACLLRPGVRPLQSGIDELAHPLARRRQLDNFPAWRLGYSRGTLGRAIR
jgi:hypothetical protein